MLRKIKSSFQLRADKDRSDKHPVPSHASPYCHASGHHTPVDGGSVGSFSSIQQCPSTWNSPASDSGYESLDGGKSPFPLFRGEDAQSMRSFHNSHSRPQTHTSSIYSTDMPSRDTPEPFPTVQESMEAVASENAHPTFESWSRSATSHARRPDGLALAEPLQPPRSRFARLNDMPTASSPGSVMFPEDVYDLGAGIEGIERQETREKRPRPRRRWGSASSFSLVTLPGKIRRLSRAYAK